MTFKYIDAIQYKVVEIIQCRYGIVKETNSMDIAHFVDAEFLRQITVPNGTPEGRTFVEVMTSKGKVEVNIGDWIVRSVSGDIQHFKFEGSLL